MKLIKTIGAYIVAGAATAVGWKMVEKLGDPYNRTVLKQKFKTIKRKLKKNKRET